MELSLVGLRVAQEVAARGSFTAAADALGYTQSAVSRQVATLEAAAGATLFERQARGVRPTGAGAILLRHGAAVLDRVAAAELELDGLRDRLEGRLAVGAFPTALAALVPRTLARVRDEHPAITVALREGGTPAQLRRLRAGRIDVAVVAAGSGLEYAFDDLEVDHLAAGGLLVAVPAEHRLAQRGWITVGDLEGEPWIVGDTGDGGPQFGPWPTLAGTPAVSHAVRDWTARLGLVAAGAGICVVPALMDAALPAGVRTVRVDDPRPMPRALLAATRPGRSATTQAFVTALHTTAAELGLPVSPPPDPA